MDENWMENSQEDMVVYDYDSHLSQSTKVCVMNIIHVHLINLKG